MTEPEPYGRGEFYRILAEVEGYLAELRYIDTAMAYLEDMGLPQWAAPSENTSSITVEFGRTFPFEKRYVVHEDFHLFWQESRKSQVEAELRGLVEQADSWAATEIDSIKTRVEPFTWPVGAVYERECLDPVLAAHQRL